MATLVLGIAAPALAGGLGLTGFAANIFVAGASLVGGFIDQMLFAPPTRKNIGPKLGQTTFQGSAIGSFIPQVEGRSAIAGNVIWCTRFRQKKKTKTTGGKGIGGGQPKVKNVTYSYSASFAVALCEGIIVDIGTIWADGAPMKMKDVTWRIYYGDEDQEPDPKHVAVEGEDFSPGYRGTAYIVFEELALEDFGNRIPQLRFEVFKTNSRTTTKIDAKIESLVFGPGLGEWAYATTPKFESEKKDKTGETRKYNVNTTRDYADFVYSVGQLKRLNGSWKRALIESGWFCKDLRCTIARPEPMTSNTVAISSGLGWTVSGVSSSTASKVSLDPKSKSYWPGTPSDRSIFEAIQHLTDEGAESIGFIPRLYMDIPPGNTLTNPYTNTTPQPNFPGASLITLPLAPTVGGTTDKTATATTQVNGFFGTGVLTSHFGTWDGNTIPYTGPAGWSYRRMVLHYAKLCAAAGGVDVFLIGWGLTQLDRIRSNVAGDFPTVNALWQLLQDCRTILGSSVKISYAASWTEWKNFQANDGTGDLYYHLDKIWSDANCDFVGINHFAPLSDWRDTPGHTDSLVYPSIYDQTYLKANIQGGEYYNWFYATNLDRIQQVRTTITDSLGIVSALRLKDILGFWQQNHFDRPGGVLSVSHTNWVRKSKPIWFTSFGCGAIDKGTNSPGVLYDERVYPTARERKGDVPLFSGGGRDESISRQYFRAHMDYWLDATHNPDSTEYTGKMVDTDRMYGYFWDVRPFPVYPARTNLWPDTGNWYFGHHLSGRIGMPMLSDVILRYADEYDVTIEPVDLDFALPGMMIGSLASFRDIAEQLALAYQFSMYESQGTFTLIHRNKPPELELTWEDVIVPSGGSQDTEGYTASMITRGQESDLPAELQLKYQLDDFQYGDGSTYARRETRFSTRSAEVSVNVLMNSDQAQNVADIMMQESWIGREKWEAVLPPSLIRLDPTDVIDFVTDSKTYRFALDTLGYEYSLPARGTQIDPTIYANRRGPLIRGHGRVNFEPGLAVISFVEIPPVISADRPYAPFLIVSAYPWPGGVNVFRSTSSSTYVLDSTITVAQTIGSLTQDLPAGPFSRWDYVGAIFVEIQQGEELESKSEMEVLNGGNLAVIEGVNGEWEIVQWQTATLIGANTYKLTNLIRGNHGTELASFGTIFAGARFIVIDDSWIRSTGPSTMKDQPLTWKFGPSSDNIGDPSYTQATYTPKSIGLRPLSVVQIAGVKDSGTGDISITWIRRTRFDGDNWDNADVPLNEEIESYRVQFYDAAGVNVVRIVTVSTPLIVYTLAQQVADRGATVTALTVKIGQISTSFGIGTTKLATFAF